MIGAIIGFVSRAGSSVDTDLWMAAIEATAVRGDGGVQEIRRGSLQLAWRGLGDDAIAEGPAGTIALVDGAAWVGGDGSAGLRRWSAADWAADGPLQASMARLVNAWEPFGLLRWQADQVLLTVDRFGGRPMYHATLQDGFAFSSSLRALVQLLDRRVLDEAALVDVFRFRMLGHRQTLVAGVEAVEPGGWVLASGQGVIDQRRYWRMDFDRRAHVHEVPITTWVDRTSEALQSSVARLCSGRHHVNVFLSGGVDSSIIAAIAAATHPNVTALTLEIEGFANPELDRARKVAAQLGMRHEVVRAPASSVAMNQQWLTQHLEQPPRHINNLALLELYRRAGELGGPVISGVAADAFFGSKEPRNVAAMLRRERLRRALPTPLARLAGGVLGALADPRGRLGRIGEALRHDAATRCLRLEGIEYPPADAAQVARITDGRLISESFGQAVWNGDEALVSRTRRLYLYILSRSELVRNDVMGAAFGVETFYPFLGPEVHAVVRELPDEMHHLDGYTKPVLRALCARLVSEEVGYWSKMGFPSPDSDWLRGPLAHEVARLGQAHPVLDRLLPAGQRAQLDPQRSFELLWTLLNLGALSEELGLEPLAAG